MADKKRQRTQALTLGVVVVVFGLLGWLLLQWLPAWGMGSTAGAERLLHALASGNTANTEETYFARLQLGDATMLSVAADSHASWRGGQAAIVDVADGNGIVIFGHICGPLAVVGLHSDYVQAQRRRDEAATVNGFFAFCQGRFPKHEFVQIAVPKQ